ncbi:MAG: SDR family oxidoreductase [Chromatiales bacterium]|nr:SDR family oxidoreductase [Chromatiales bacterium]
MPRDAREPLAGQAIFVTGAARGIGAAAARRLAADGAVVGLADVLDCNDTLASIREAGGTARAWTLDISDRDACMRVIGEAITDFGRLDALVCNAGVCPPGSVAGDWIQWHRVIDINLHGTQHCVAAAWEPMSAQGAGNIVIVTSMAWYQGGVIVGTEYSASKAALVGMTRHIARNGGPLGIRCNAVAPGFIDTDMTADFPRGELDLIPLRRRGTPEDVAGPIGFLCGPDSAYMTGCVLNVTGGIVLAA